MSDITKDQELMRDGRKNALADDQAAGIQVTASLRDQIVQKLYQKLKEEELPRRLVELWQRGNTERAEWLERQREYIVQIDEFIDPIYTSSTDWGSVLHLPTILTVCKTFHARMVSALLSIDPPFTVRARQEAFVDSEMLVSDFIRYALKDWMNYNKGIDPVIDSWIWSWVTTGVGITKSRWDKKFTRFIDVQEIPVPIQRMVVDEEGHTQIVEDVEMQEEEVARTLTTFEGPCLDLVNVEDLLIIGGEGDPDKADSVIQEYALTASELLSLADQKIFNMEAVEEVIEKGRSSKSEGVGDDLKAQRMDNSGLGYDQGEQELDRYKILECYLQYDCDGSGINSEIVVWINPDTRALLRATYLHRIMPCGYRPFVKIDFHRRAGSTYGAGLVELLYSLGKEIDAMHNMRVDVGILTSLPFGFYRPTSQTPEESLAFEPGTLIPLDNPGQDVFFPNLGNRTSFGFQEEAALMNQVERLTSVSDLSLGIIGAQGATRTATGTRAILGEANANLDIFLRRLNVGWKQTLKYLWSNIQHKVKPGFVFRITGEDGRSVWHTATTEALKGQYDFELEGNSTNSNKQVRLEVANLLVQVTGNPMDIQLGLVSPRERYEAIRRLLMENGIKDVSKYVRKPNQIPRVFTPLEIANRLLYGMDVPLDGMQDLDGFMAFVENIMSDDELLGQFDTNAIAALVAKAQEAQALKEAIAQQQAQQANMMQQQINASQGANPGAPVGTSMAGNQ